MEGNMKYALLIALILGVFAGTLGPSLGQQADPCAQNPAYCP
jgi:hypothetical protein